MTQAGAAAPDPAALRLLHVSDLHLEEPGDAGSLACSPRWPLSGRRGRCLSPATSSTTGGSATRPCRRSGSRSARCRPGGALPGNHDPFMPGSPYPRADSARTCTCSARRRRDPRDRRARPGHLGPAALQLRRLPADGQRPAPRPGHLAGRAGARPPDPGPDDLQRAYPIYPAEIAGSGRDYVALGHWDCRSTPAPVRSRPPTRARRAAWASPSRRRGWTPTAADRCASSASR